MLPGMRSRVLIAELDVAVAAHLAGQLADEVYEVVPVTSSGAVFGQVLAGDVAAIVLGLPDSADVLRDLPDAGFEGGVVVVDVPTSPGDVTSTSLDDAAAGRPVLLLHHLDHLASAVEQVIELSGGGSREEVDVPATVAWVLAQHAPGTHMEGPSSGGVQVIRATLDPEAFDAFLVAVAAVVGIGSRVRLEHDDGKVRIAVAGARVDPVALLHVRETLGVLGGTLELESHTGDAFSAAVPSGISEWE